MALNKSLCRCCMREESQGNGMKKEMFSIFSHEENMTIWKLLQQTIPCIKCHTEDELPKQICFQCLDELKHFYRFQQTCLNTEAELYKLIRSRTELKDGSNEFVVETLKAGTDDELFVETLEDGSDELFIETLEDGSDESFIETLEELGDDDEEFYCDASMDSQEDSTLNNDIEVELSTNIDDIIESYSDLSGLDMTGFSDEDNNDRNYAVRGIEKGNNVVKKVVQTHVKSKQTPKKMYSCDKCNKNFQYEAVWYKHIKVQCQTQQLVCSICEREYQSKSALRAHLKAHASPATKSFLCAECGKSFMSSSSLNQHLIRHMNDRKYACEHCPKAFTTNADLYSHMRTHSSKLKSHVCDECGRGFSRQFMLKQHKMYHTNERNFQCDFCEKRFFTNEKLQRHRRIHTGEKPYKCKFCDKAYVQSNELSKHLRIHLGENIYQCELCPQRFPNVKSTKEHFISHKNDDYETRVMLLEELNALQVKGLFCK